jgi:hypothetical protein
MMRKTIGDPASVKVIIPQALRPISARIGELKSTIGPGPQDYRTIDPDIYKRRGNPNPKLTFAKSLRYTKSAERLAANKSPAPNMYRPKSAVILSN